MPWDGFNQLLDKIKFHELHSEIFWRAGDAVEEFGRKNISDNVLPDKVVARSFFI